MKCLVLISHGREYAGQSLALPLHIHKYALMVELSHHRLIFLTSCMINLLKLTFHQQSTGTSSTPSQTSLLDTLLGSAAWKSHKLSNIHPTRPCQALTTL